MHFFSRSSASEFCLARAGAAAVVTLTILAVASCAGDLRAEVTRIEITSRQPFAGGESFGDTGPYEVLRGKLTYAVDPDNPHNARIVDLHLAKQGRLRSDVSPIVEGRHVETLGDDPRDELGRVVFSGDFVLIKPVDLSRGNHRLLYDVNNRGNLYMLGYYNDAPTTNTPREVAHAGNGWLMEQGYSLLWTAWNWDVESISRNPLRIYLPIAVEPDGSPMTGLINAELAVAEREGKRVEKIAWGGSRCYPADPDQIDSARLTVRDFPDTVRVGRRREVPREQWQFARLDDDGNAVPDLHHVFLPAGYAKGKLYELIYVAKNPRIVGLGLAAIRDALSFFQYDSVDAHGAPNPLAIDDTPDPEFTYIFGISQSGRVITHMIYQGFHVDEQGRMIFQGARPHVAGGGKGGFNFRFAQTTHHPKHFSGNYFPADFFPFNFMPAGELQFDPNGQPGRKLGDVLAVAKQLDRIPKIMICNHEGEYWTRSASLIHTDTQGLADVDSHPDVRIYMINGVRHGYPSRGSRRFISTAAHAFNQLDPRPVGRALLVALDQWVSEGVDPPPSRVPRIDRGQLVLAEMHGEDFPAIPACEVAGRVYPALDHPKTNLRPPRVDYGPRWWTEGIQSHVPPKYFDEPYTTLVPAYDEDGNPVGGIRLPDLEVPLATHQGFNPRARETGAAGYLNPFDCSFWPFAKDRASREANADPRRSIAERYESHEDYVAKLEAAAHRLVKDRLLLTHDAAAIIERGKSLQWPPEPTDRWPFWKMQ